MRIAVVAAVAVAAVFALALTTVGILFATGVIGPILKTTTETGTTETSQSSNKDSDKDDKDSKKNSTTPPKDFVRQATPAAGSQTGQLAGAALSQGQQVSVPPPSPQRPSLPRPSECSQGPIKPFSPELDEQPHGAVPPQRPLLPDACSASGCTQPITIQPPLPSSTDGGHVCRMDSNCIQRTANEATLWDPVIRFCMAIRMHTGHLLNLDLQRFLLTGKLSDNSEVHIYMNGGQFNANFGRISVNYCPSTSQYYQQVDGNQNNQLTARLDNGSLTSTLNGSTKSYSLERMDNYFSVENNAGRLTATQIDNDTVTLHTSNSVSSPLYNVDMTKTSFKFTSDLAHVNVTRLLTSSNRSFTANWLQDRRLCLTSWHAVAITKSGYSWQALTFYPYSFDMSSWIQADAMTRQIYAAAECARSSYCTDDGNLIVRHNNERVNAKARPVALLSLKVDNTVSTEQIIDESETQIRCRRDTDQLIVFKTYCMGYIGAWSFVYNSTEKTLNAWKSDTQIVLNSNKRTLHVEYPGENCTVKYIKCDNFEWHGKNSDHVTFTTKLVDIKFKEFSVKLHDNGLATYIGEAYWRRRSQVNGDYDMTSVCFLGEKRTSWAHVNFTAGSKRFAYASINGSSTSATVINAGVETWAGARDRMGRTLLNWRIHGRSATLTTASAILQVQ